MEVEPRTLWSIRTQSEDDCRYFRENSTLLNALLSGRHDERQLPSDIADDVQLSSIQRLVERTNEYVDETLQKRQHAASTAADATSSVATEHHKSTDCETTDDSTATCSSTATEICSLAALTNEYHDTPLHQICTTMVQRTDLVQYLITQYPEAVLMKNNLHYRPIDIVSNRIIMLEEVIKYRSDVAITTTHVGLPSEMDLMWETVYELAKAAVVNTAKNQSAADSFQQQHQQQQQQPQPRSDELHTFVKCTGFPICLFQRALKRYSHQVHKEVDNDTDKNRLLHIIVRTPPRRSRSTVLSSPSRNNDSDNDNGSDDDGDDDDEESDTSNRELFPYILKADLKAASVVNGHGQIPLEVAVRAGHSWSSSFVQALIKTYPEGLNMLNLLPSVISYVLERLLRQTPTQTHKSMTAHTTTTTTTTTNPNLNQLVVVFEYLRSSNTSSSTNNTMNTKQDG
jgi:hypothetical protein